ncbi:hypothetical protein HMPREF1057_01411 [Bacteroides finegoldii CL09T03C10]|uniref:Uncharacterized protein n=1 Tax=Bacteroides finegoldii CL09T03C10 TaxID=997888 RepID=K5CRV1_9BACE|nr:hypothetical protein HMPREF1057_01411 [Bacteroides finegoldii CL09T03C10]
MVSVGASKMEAFAVLGPISEGFNTKLLQHLYQVCRSAATEPVRTKFTVRKSIQQTERIIDVGRRISEMITVIIPPSTSARPLQRKYSISWPTSSYPLSFALAFHPPLFRRFAAYGSSMLIFLILFNSLKILN